jgi:hypothetical protein
MVGQLREQVVGGGAIEAVEGFIEHKKAGTMKKGDDDSQLAPHPLGQFATEGVLGAVQTQPGKEAISVLCRGRAV